jgi:uncharacterized protein
MIVDGHLHLAGSPTGVLRRMDELGVQRTVLVGVSVRDLSVLTIRDSIIFRVPLLLRTIGVLKTRAILRSRRFHEASLPQPDNSQVAAAIAAYPERFWGFAFINPMAPDAPVETERLLDAGFRGIKLALPQYPAALNGPQVTALCEVARARRVPVFCHQGLTPGAADLAAMVRRFPDNRFVVAHAGVQYFEDAVALARGQPNVWLDTSSYFVTATKLRRLVTEVGPAKLVFGSDYPVMATDPGQALQKIAALRISATERAAILGGNLLEILGEVTAA